ncbi:hypothetical protein [Bacillus horti]|nr:hypothetical protein [Bacillus horti]
MKITSTSIFLLIILILSGCSKVLEPPYQYGNNPINAANLGFAAQDREWLYYVNHENMIARTNGTVTETYDDAYGRGLNVTGDPYTLLEAHIIMKGNLAFRGCTKKIPIVWISLLTHLVSIPLLL